ASGAAASMPREDGTGWPGRPDPPRPARPAHVPASARPGTRRRMSEHSDDEIRKRFGELVNLQPKELEEFLGTDESQEVGQKDGGGESVGHRSGRRIVDIKRKRKDELSDDDVAHMRKVVGYIERHVAQGGPQDDVEHSRWRASLMNWGHDPLR
ncbi:MAG: DNA-binding protein, partial [Solirubrobacterales bacterium]|nr:DNA-binding protein [Solirubrobacterales bacterium]